MQCGIVAKWSERSAVAHQNVGSNSAATIRRRSSWKRIPFCRPNSAATIRRRSSWKRIPFCRPGCKPFCAQNFSTPPPAPQPPKKGYRYKGGGGLRRLEIKKNPRGIISSLKMMILQGVRRLIPYIRVCYANDPQNGGGGHTAPDLCLLWQPSSRWFLAFQLQSRSQCDIVRDKF